MSPLMLLDLDNTLVDRDMAFRGWARRFLAQRSLPAQELNWLTTLDCGGYFPREALLRAAFVRYGLHTPLEELLREYRETMTELIRCPDSHLDALRAAREAGWPLGIVTNGSTEQQRAKIEQTGLDEFVDGWVISEEAACAKPDPQIFQLAAARCGAAKPDGSWTASTWMIGDHPPADIAGARVAGLRSVWLEHGRPWPELGYRPTLSAPDLPGAIACVLAA